MYLLYKNKLPEEVEYYLKTGPFKLKIDSKQIDVNIYKKFNF